ncbi:abortive infection protein [Corynebacterium diphtheriae]|uniref:Abi family protein n=1 Tax=Corynebacterium diphtheriae TaxID=1717 RepID=UPI0013CC68D4|nr:Abi family protein [Corynebacterium diphtheriae]CAB0824804.1 abortive infection protein [Corynebacterium diphtheriae]CAB1023579.1 abortive infection protein [Corynebacterium diphtheriae]
MSFFVQHFDDVYEGQLPIWALTELLELGQLAVLYSGLQREIATGIAKDYAVPTKALFRSWLASINDVRNFSAHHARLFNRKIVHAPKRPKAGAIEELEHLRDPGSSKGGFGLYSVVAIMAYLLHEIEPETTWPRRMVELTDQFPTNEYIDIDSMGFPQDWKSWTYGVHPK